ncbi:MAG: DUF393 domain-containing protein [bacterium]|nr:DUF393 domain-containing protein [bacterium]
MASPIGSEASPTLIYDGDCDFCRRCADWIANRLPAGTSVLASQQADLAAAGLSDQQATDAAWWIDTDGAHHRGHRAIAESLRACGGSWSRLGRLLILPGVSLLAAGVYELIARNRHRLGCRNCLEKSQRGGPALSD